MAIERNPLRPALIALAAGLLAATPAPALAQSGARTGNALHAGTLEVPINKSQVVNTDRPIAKAMIGNETVADILPITDRSVYLSALFKLRDAYARDGQIQEDAVSNAWRMHARVASHMPASRQLLARTYTNAFVSRTRGARAAA